MAVERYRCFGCNNPEPSWVQPCPSCQECHGMRLIDPRAPRPTAAAVAGEDVRRRPPLNETEPEPDVRLSTGLFYVDRVFGGTEAGGYGIHVPTTVLLGGAPGSGKSTLLMTICANVVAHEHVVYVSSEQSKPEFRATLIRCGFDDRLAGPDGMVMEYEPGADAAIALLREERPRLAIVDSLSDMTDATCKIDSESELAIHVAGKFAALAAELDCAIILVSHLNKSGLLVGRKRLEHKVRGIMMFEKLSAVRRVVHFPDKNRTGQIGVKAYFDMLPAGLAEVDNEQAEAELMGADAEGDDDRGGPPPVDRPPRRRPRARARA